MIAVATHKRALVVFFVAALLWGFAFPVGVVRERTLDLYLKDYEVNGRKVYVTGEAADEVVGYGMPEGFVRFRSFTWGPLAAPEVAAPLPPGTYAATPPFTAHYTMMLRRGYTPLAVTPALVEALGPCILSNRLDRESEPLGLFVSWSALLPCAIFAIVSFLIASGLWIAVARWRWNPARGSVGNAVRLAGLALVPTLVSSGTIWVEWRRVRALGPAWALVPAPVVVLGSSFFSSFLLVAWLCRKEWQRGSVDSQDAATSS